MIEEIDNGFKFRQENFVVLHENVLISFIVCHLYLHSVSFIPSSQLTARSFLTRHLWELLVTEHVPGLGNQYCIGTVPVMLKPRMFKRLSTGKIRLYPADTYPVDKDLSDD